MIIRIKKKLDLKNILLETAKSSVTSSPTQNFWEIIKNNEITNNKTMKIKKEISCHIMLSRDEIEQLKQLLLEPERFSEELSRKERKLIEEIIEGFEQEIEKGRRNMIDAVDETIDIFNGKINQTFPKSTSQQKNQMIELIVEFAEAIQEGSRKYKKEDSDRINNQFFKDIRTRIEK